MLVRPEPRVKWAQAWASFAVLMEGSDNNVIWQIRSNFRQNDSELTHKENLEASCCLPHTVFHTPILRAYAAMRNGLRAYRTHVCLCKPQKSSRFDPVRNSWPQRGPHEIRFLFWRRTRATWDTMHCGENRRGPMIRLAVEPLIHPLRSEASERLRWRRTIRCHSSAHRAFSLHAEGQGSRHHRRIRARSA